MFAPKYSIRTLLLLMAVFAVYFLFVGFAFQGYAWAVGISVAVGSLAVVAAVHGLLFLGCWALANRRNPAGDAVAGQHTMLAMPNDSQRVSLDCDSPPDQNKPLIESPSVSSLQNPAEHSPIDSGEEL